MPWPDEIGTDPTRHKGVAVAYGKEYSESWFGKEKSGWFVNGFVLAVATGAVLFVILMRQFGPSARWLFPPQADKAT